MIQIECEHELVKLNPFTIENSVVICGKCRKTFTETHFYNDITI